MEDSPLAQLSQNEESFLKNSPAKLPLGTWNLFLKQTGDLNACIIRKLHRMGISLL